MVHFYLSGSSFLQGTKIDYDQTEAGHIKQTEKRNIKDKYKEELT